MSSGFNTLYTIHYTPYTNLAFRGYAGAPARIFFHFFLHMCEFFCTFAPGIDITYNMKKVFALSMVILVCTNMAAQEVLHRFDNTYYCGQQPIKQSEMLEWYAQHNCQVAYDHFAKGQKMSKAGWALFGIGLGLEGCSMGCIFRNKTTLDSSQAPARARALNYHQKLFISGIILGSAAAACEIACIPTLIVGYHKMHRSVDLYNVLCNTADAKPYWAIQADENGIGLAFHF